MMGLIKDFLALVVPPPEEHDPTGPYVRRWRWAIFGALCTVTSALAIQMSLAWGAIPIVFSGFASSQQIRELRDGQDEIVHAVKNLAKETSEIVIGNQIDNLRIMECDARKSGKLDLARAFASRITDKQRDYRRVMGSDRPLRSCEDV